MVDRPDVEAPRGVEPTGTNSRTATHTPAHTGWQEQTKASLGRQGDTLHVTWINPSVASTIRSPTRHDPPREHVETRSRGMYNTRFAAAMAQGRRPDPFRTRKLRPGTAMVLHLEGCGRVARRRTQTLKGRGHHTCPLPFHIPGHNRRRPPTPAHGTNGPSRDNPRRTPTMNRQVRHHTYDRHGIREPKIIALGDPFLRVCGGIHNPGGRHRATIQSPGIRRPAHARAYTTTRYRHTGPAGRLLPAYAACPGIRI